MGGGGGVKELNAVALLCLLPAYNSIAVTSVRRKRSLQYEYCNQSECRRNAVGLHENELNGRATHHNKILGVHHRNWTFGSAVQQAERYVSSDGVHQVHVEEI